MNIATAILLHKFFQNYYYKFYYTSCAQKNQVDPNNLTPHVSSFPFSSHLQSKAPQLSYMLTEQF